jgi:predicted  nucleic acid-binding Zn-ribbon protein
MFRDVREIKEIVMATQADVDAILTAVQQVEADIQTASDSIQTELNALANQNPSVDLSALQAEVSKLDPAVQALGALTPQAPAPAASPADNPPAA